MSRVLTALVIAGLTFFAVGTTAAVAKDCTFSTAGGATATVPEGESVHADPSEPALNARNSCSCPDADYSAVLTKPARLTCVDGHLLISQQADCDCARRSGRHFVTDLRPLLIKRRNTRRIECPDNTVLTGCTMACHGTELDADLSAGGNSCRVDANTRCSGSKGFLMVAICLKVDS